MRACVVRLLAITFCALLLSPTRLQAGSSACVGDCDDNGVVSFDDIATAVRIALDDPDAPPCTSTDINGDIAITIEELVVAAHNGGAVCPPESTPTHTIAATPTLTRTPTITPISGVAVVRVAPAVIQNSGTTTLTVTIDPNGVALAAVTIAFRVDPAKIHLLTVTGLNGTSASGVVGGDAFSFGNVFSENRTTPLDVGMVQLEGHVVGGQVQLIQQVYTDSEFNDTVIDTLTVVATVVAAS